MVENFFSSNLKKYMKEIVLAIWCMYVISEFVVNMDCISTIQIFLLFDCHFQTINSSPKAHAVTLFSWAIVK